MVNAGSVWVWQTSNGERLVALPRHRQGTDLVARGARTMRLYELWVLRSEGLVLSSKAKQCGNKTALRGAVGGASDSSPRP